MGAGYIAGAYFFVRVARETRWHRIQVGFLPVTAFTLFMAIGTFAHLDRFVTEHVAFWIWVGFYVATPVLVPLAWWRNRASDPGRRNRASRRCRGSCARRCWSSVVCSRRWRWCCCSRPRR